MVVNIKGRLEAITGPMFCGKSSELSRRVEHAKIAKQNVIAYNPAINDRYAGENYITTHDGRKMPAYAIDIDECGCKSILEQVYKEEEDNPFDVIGIEEVQFFDEAIVDIIEELADNGKRVVVSGLNADFRGEPFGCMPEILAKADDITMLKAICMVCGDYATKTQRLIDGKPAHYDSPIVLVGGEELYEARCRKHHIVPKDLG